MSNTPLTHFYFAISCNQNPTSTTSENNSEMKAVYEKNLAAFKASIAAFEKENIEGWAS